MIFCCIYDLYYFLFATFSFNFKRNEVFFMGVYVFPKKEIDDISEQLELIENFATTLVDTSMELRCRLDNNHHNPMEAVGE